MLRCATAEQLAAPAFLGLEHPRLAPSDRAVLEPFLARHPHPLSGYTFGSLLSWNEVFRFRRSFTRSGALIISWDLGDGERHLMQPVGPLDEASGLALLEAGARLDYPLKLVAVGRPFLEAHPWFAARCRVEEDGTCANYLYLAEDLATLAGRRYSKKRNLIAQAAHSYRWSSEPLGRANAADALEVLSAIAEEEPAPSEWVRRDTAALTRTLQLVGELGQEGLLVRVEGRPAALSLFEARPPDTLEIHFERALRRHKGLHQLVNRMSAELARARGLSFVNREEDLGDPGLRQAKLSYFPVRMADAFRLWVPRAAPVRAVAAEPGARR